MILLGNVYFAYPMETVCFVEPLEVQAEFEGGGARETRLSNSKLREASDEQRRFLGGPLRLLV